MNKYIIKNKNGDFEVSDKQDNSLCECPSDWPADCGHFVSLAGKKAYFNKAAYLEAKAFVPNHSIPKEIKKIIAQTAKKQTKKLNIRPIDYAFIIALVIIYVKVLAF